MIIIVAGLFEFVFRDPRLYEQGRPLVGDFCRLR